MAILEVKNSCKSFAGKEILKDISLTCKTGDVLGIFGRNGAGKSTLLKMIYGSMIADSIELKINSSVILPKNIIPSKQIAYLPQDSFLPKGLKVRDVIPLFFNPGEKQDVIFYDSRIAIIENTKIGNLSIGELKYLEFLLVSNLEHPFLLLDEPLSMVEPLFKNLIKERILKLKEVKGILIVDHYYEDVLKITTKNFLIKEGIKIDVKDSEDLKKFGYLKNN